MRRVSLIVAALALVLTGAPAPAVPPLAGGALASANVDLVATVPDAGAVGAKILGDTMYVTTLAGLQIYDLSLGLGVPVPAGALPLPHFENEDVDTNGDILLISADFAVGVPQVRLFVVDVSNVNAPVLLSTIDVPDGHTVSCINDCAYGWLAGSGEIYVVDLRDPTRPEVVGSFAPGVGGTHDVQVDDAGVAWIVGGGGIAGYTTANPVSPTLYVRQRGQFHNDFILHNSWRPHATAVDPVAFADDEVDLDKGEVVLITEENWLGAQNNLCGNDGRFQTGWLHEVDGRVVLDKLDDFHIGQGTGDPPGQKKPAGGTCSSHYFDYRGDGIVAVAWYEQGVRFLDVSNPTDIRQVGFYMPAITAAWSAKFHGDYLYTLDVARGIDVLRFSGGAGDPPVLAPGYNVPDLLLTAPSPRWGWACRIPLLTS